MWGALKSFALDSEQAQGVHLHLIHYCPHGCAAQVCAAVWEERGQVRLASPLLRRRDGVLDPQPFARQFSDSLPCLDLFEDVMGWLDAACYAASRCHQVRLACHQHPEWDLRCEPFDSSDAALMSLRSLVRAASEHAALPPALLRECARMAVQRLLREEPRLAGGQFESVHTDDADDLGVVEMPVGTRVLVSVRHQVRPTQAVSLGVLAHYRMAAMVQGKASADRCLLVLPNLELHRPMTMTPRTAIANLDPLVLRDALFRLVSN
jgi:hypothetical protein